jgi:hypothetical protein
MVAIKPHTVTVAPVTQTAASSGVLGNPAIGAASSPIACLVVPMQPAEVYHQFGVELTDPRKIYLEVSDSSHFSPNARIEFGGVAFWQKGPVEVHQTGDVTDCAVVYMSKNQYP